MDDSHTSRAESRAESLWRRLKGLFGGEALERKFGATPPEEWVTMIGRLNDFELARGMRRMAYSGSKFVPTLPEFVKLCRDVGGTGEFEEGPRPNPETPKLESPQQMRPWLIQGNLHLLNYIRTMTPRNPLRYSSDNRYDAETRQVAFGPLTHRYTAPLVEMKNAWVADMEADWAQGIKHPDGGKAMWIDCMRTAEEMIDRLRAEAAA